VQHFPFENSFNITTEAQYWFILKDNIVLAQICALGHGFILKLPWVLMVQLCG
jgi:hypothetical protein